MKRTEIGRFTRELVAAGVLAAAVASAPMLVVRGGAAPLAQAGSPARPECAQLAKLALANVTITSATVVPAEGGTPEYCKVLGALETTILFEVSLPVSAWNNRYWVAGGGGYNGSIPDLKQALQHGYAAAGSDTGHQGSDASFAWKNEKAQIDYGYRATHLVTALGKQIVKAYYGQSPQRSYFVGCSNGGKMGLTEVQRYPEDFNGAITGCPVIDRTNLMAAFIWDAQSQIANPIPKAKLAAIAKATLAACDAQDGLADGVIDRPDQCSFDPKVLTCKGADGPDCLTPGQVASLQKLYSGPVNSKGEHLFPGYPPGHEEDYAQFLTGDADPRTSSTWKLGDGFLRYFMHGPDYDTMKQFSLDTGYADLKPFVDAQDAYRPDLSAFRARGGRLIMYVGWADHSIPPGRAIAYYDDMQKKSGSDFARLFMVPGMHHCANGPGPWNFGGRGQRWIKDDPEHDAVRALERWVEQGVAPSSLIAAKFTNDDPKQGVARTRPLCPYPQVAKYKGNGSIDDATNFACAAAR